MFVCILRGERYLIADTFSSGKHPHSGAWWDFNDADRPKVVPDIASELSSDDVAREAYVAFYQRVRPCCVHRIDCLLQRDVMAI